MNNSLNDKFENVKNLINKSENIFIASHINPDGDNIGSILAMGLALKSLDKNVNVLKTDAIPKDFNFLPGIDLIQDFKDDMDSKDLFIVLDSSDGNRLGSLKKLLKITKNIVNIDHHVSNTNFGKINVVDSLSCATGEIVYRLLDYMDINIDKNIATNIYTAISTDSGSFKYESVTGDTHRIIANLLDIGIDHSNINLNLY
jgi:bifunctional oligoribonuclease and PAP phosphatase NrnA